MKNRTLLMIPGPIEFEPAVLSAMGEPTTSHLAASFIEAFGQSLEQMRQVFESPSGQPLVLAGSGTLAMDCAGANLVEPGDKALVVNTGYFSERFASILQRYGAQVTLISTAVGGHPHMEQIKTVLESDSFKLMTVTHVDTSTAVLADIQQIAALGRQYGVQVVVDGVCSVAGEELQMDTWGVDLALTASQKAIGVPPGLALLMIGSRAMEKFQKRSTPVLNYYADWTNWLPIMQAYEARKPGYFGTPPVNLIFALRVSLGQILKEGMATRISRHIANSRACKAGVGALEMGQVPLKPEFAAHTLTAPKYPPGVSGADFLAGVLKAGVTLAGGLYPSIRTEYFRIGHMGAATQADVLVTISAIESALVGCGYKFSPGAGIEAAKAAGKNPLHFIQKN
jgi:alanine-glyoxylate transaminase/serine-glyoxylate transaminase/serine-pyruvate transaminase